MKRGRPITKVKGVCIKCGTDIYIKLSKFKESGNYCSRSCAAGGYWQKNKHTAERWIDGVSKTYILRHKVEECHCGKRYIKTRGDSQLECLFCINPTIKRELIYSLV